MFYTIFFLFKIIIQRSSLIILVFTKTNIIKLERCIIILMPKAESWWILY